MNKDAWGQTLDEWRRVIEEFHYTFDGIERVFKINKNQLKKWLFKGVIPRKTNIKKMDNIMSKIQEQKSVPQCPVWGYATLDQVKKLKGQISPEERQRLMKKIEKQTLLRGKID